MLVSFSELIWLLLNFIVVLELWCLYWTTQKGKLRIHSLTLLLLSSSSFKLPTLFSRGARVVNCYFPSTIATLDRTIDRHSPIAFVVIRTISTGNKQQGLKTNMADKTRCDGLSKRSLRDVFLAWHVPYGTHTKRKDWKNPPFIVLWF